MSDPFDSPISLDITGAGAKRYILRLKATAGPEPGRLHFILKTGNGLGAWADWDFEIEGNGLRLQDRTDAQGRFSRDNIAFGEYALRIGEVEIVVEAISRDEEPVVFYIPSVASTEPGDVSESPEEAMGSGI